MTQAPGSSQQPGAALPAGGAAPFPPELQTASASKEDRTLAMISHLLGLVGFLGPLILYLVKKDQVSKFVLFHIKQSLFFQIALIPLFLILIIGSIVGTLLAGRILSCVFFPITGLVWVGAVVYLIIGAIQVNGGKDFEYYFIGPWVRKSL
jgi:uncharacterized Tic20 family protein